LLGLTGCSTMRPNEISPAQWARLSPSEQDQYVERRLREANRAFAAFRSQGEQQIRETQQLAQSGRGTSTGYIPGTTDTNVR
jgi:hypothetical protein